MNIEKKRADGSREVEAETETGSGKYGEKYVMVRGFNSLLLVSETRWPKTQENENPNKDNK